MFDICFRLSRRKWNRLLLDRIGAVIGDCERRLLIESCRKAKSKEKWLQQVVAFAQDLEMSASMAHMQNKHEEYVSRLQTAAVSYLFVKELTSNSSLKHRMQQAEDEIRKRLSRTTQPHLN